jgi:hypothetical protein
MTSNEPKHAVTHILAEWRKEVEKELRGSEAVCTNIYNDPKDRSVYNERAWRSARILRRIAELEQAAATTIPTQSVGMEATCQCGRVKQSTEPEQGWNAQGIGEDLPGGYMLIHNLNEDCYVEPPTYETGEGRAEALEAERSTRCVGTVWTNEARAYVDEILTALETAEAEVRRLGTKK